jgi:carbamoyl-phosphate synthase small subunit
MAERGIEVHVMPYNSSFADIQAINPDGVFLSNGPGDPSTMTETIDLVRQILGEEIPVFGICFGHQILGRALGFETYKLQFGHRGINQPVLDRKTGKVEITAHNHGFALQAPTDSGFSTVYGPGQVTHVSLNDGVVEGLEHLAFSITLKLQQVRTMLLISSIALSTLWSSTHEKLRLSNGSRYIN